VSLLSVDLQEHLADAQSRALVMRHNDFDLCHIGQCCPTGTMSPPI
jgi:hypothetical protein